jgi:hypothetical protein
MREQKAYLSEIELLQRDIRRSATITTVLFIIALAIVTGMFAGIVVLLAL